MRLHIHSPPAKAHALSLQPKALLHCGVACQLDCSTRHQHALPRQSKSAPQDRSHLPRRPRKPRRPRNPPVSRNRSPRDRTNRPLNPQTHRSRRITFLFCHPKWSRWPILAALFAAREWGFQLTPPCETLPARHTPSCRLQTPSTTSSPASSRPRVESDSPV
jgi:hypothetical protein